MLREIVKETSGSYNISDGSFRVLSVSAPTAIGLANKWFAELPTLTTGTVKLAAIYVPPAIRGC